MTTTHNMNSSNTNADGWAVTAMRKYLNTDTNNVFSQINDGAQNVIVTVKKDYMASYNAAAVAETPTEDKLWLLACSEIWSDGYRSGSYGYAKLKEGEQYQYYITATNGVVYNSNNNNLKKIKLGQTSASYWWLRSPFYANNIAFCAVDSSSSASSSGVSGNEGVAFGFSI